MYAAAMLKIEKEPLANINKGFETTLKMAL